MTKTQPSLEPDEHFDVLDEEKIGEDSDWSDDRDPIPEGWEDWSEIEGALTDELDSTDWSDLETVRSKVVVGYQNQASVPEMGFSSILTLCDTGASESKILLLAEQVESLADPVSEISEDGQRRVRVSICLAGREETVRLTVDESADGPMLILGRDVLGLGWVVDVDLKLGSSIETST